MYIRHLSIKVRLYLATSLCLLLVLLHTGAFLASVRQQSANMEVEHFP